MCEFFKHFLNYFHKSFLAHFEKVNTQGSIKQTPSWIGLNNGSSYVFILYTIKKTDRIVRRTI